MKSTEKYVYMFMVQGKGSDNRGESKEDKGCWKSSKSVEKLSKMKWKSSKSVVKWSEMQCSVEKGGKRDFMGKVYMSSKVVRSGGLGWKREYNMCGKKY